jgi:hypothetical protein
VDDRERAARAIACFEASTNAEFLMSVIREVAPRARRMSSEAGIKLGDDNVPGPADVTVDGAAATLDEALDTARTLADFPLLQALARAAGRRVEELRGAS